MFITTTELLEETEKLRIAAGESATQISHEKLLRWQREGLLPKQKLSGLGPGGRQESLWEKNCIERLQIIAGCVKGERLNRKTAEHALIARGFWIRGDLLKQHLLTACERMSIELEKQQRVYCPDPTDRAANLERSTHDRMSAHEKSLKTIFANCLLGYTGLHKVDENPKSLAVLSSFFRPEVLLDLIENCQPEQLEMTHQNPIVVSFAAFITTLFEQLYGQSKELSISNFADNADLNGLLNMLMPKPFGELRRKKPYPYSNEMVQYNAHLTATIIYLVYSEYKNQLLPLFPLLINEIFNKQKLVVSENIHDLLDNKLQDPNVFFNLPPLSK